MYRPRTTVVLGGVDRLKFDPNHINEGIFASYPKIAKRFDDAGVSGCVISLKLEYSGALLEDIGQTHWEVGGIAIGGECDYVLNPQSCEEVGCGKDGQPPLTVYDLLQRPEADSRLLRFNHMIAHVGYNPMLKYAKASGLIAPEGSLENVAAVPENPFSQNAYRIFYGFDAGRDYHDAAQKIETLAQLSIAILEGSIEAYYLETRYWGILLQDAEIQIGSNIDPWRNFIGNYELSANGTAPQALLVA